MRLLLVGLTACGVGVSTTDPSLNVGESSPYRLYTHCGIVSVTANGHIYYAQPILSEGAAPPGWGNPYDEGTLTMVDAHVVEFRDPSGHKATFTDTPAGPTPSVPVCS